MEIWLDTIDFATIEEGVKTGILFGVTTNPSILSQAKNIHETLLTILSIQPGPVAVQVTAKETEEMVEQGRKLFASSSRIIVKVPVNRNGLVAIQQLRSEGIPIMATAVLFPAQVLLAANLGVEYIAPYFSHLVDPFQTLKTMSEITTKLLAASLREVDHVIYCATLKISAVTIKPPLFTQLIGDQPSVEAFLQKFSTDWKNHVMV